MDGAMSSKLKYLRETGRNAIDSGESAEDVALAIYYDLFAYRGMDPDEKKWCKEVASKLMQEIADEE